MHAYKIGPREKWVDEIYLIPYKSHCVCLHIRESSKIAISLFTWFHVIYFVLLFQESLVNYNMQGNFFQKWPNPYSQFLNQSQVLMTCP